MKHASNILGLNGDKSKCHLSWREDMRSHQLSWVHGQCCSASSHRSCRHCFRYSLSLTLLLHFSSNLCQIWTAGSRPSNL